MLKKLQKGETMNTYRNVMEMLVVQKLDEMWETIDCCKCEKCKMDIIACTLNQLTPKYVVTKEGELYARLCELNNEHEIEILIALTKAIKTVKDKPKHDE
jgi:competence protein ComFB